jgi:CDP-diglyceride synthetase
MLHILIAAVVLVALLLTLAFSIMIGRRCGRAQLESQPGQKLEVLGVAEGAVFGLLGLMIAFTFAGADDRYESRKTHIIEEANAFEAAYAITDTLPPQYQPALRKNIREYLDLHLAAYSHIPYMNIVREDMEQSQIIQHKIWDQAVAATDASSNHDLNQLVLPLINKMFDLTHSGIDMVFIHPPRTIFLLLIGLAALGAFLIGYIAAENKQKRSVHIYSYVLLTALIIYIIINLEYPRVGFIRINYFDQILTDVRIDMDAIEQEKNKK